MKLLKTIFASFIANGVGLYLANAYVPGFYITLDAKQLAIAAAALMAINLLIRPVLKLILWPLMILTLGLAGLLINAIALYILDYLMPSVTISGFTPLVYATLIITAANLAVGLLAKIL